MTLSSYRGPALFGFETDMPVRRAAQISVHTSPLAALGGKDAGGMNVYIRELACHLARRGLAIDIFTRRTNPNTPETIELCPGVNVVAINAGPPEPLDKNELFSHLPEFSAEMALYSLREGVRYDVVHAHYWLSGWTAHLVKRYWDTPFVLMFHTTAHMKNAVSAVAERETALREKTERHLLTLADSLIAANPDERADLIWRLGTPVEKVCTIPPGVDVELFQPGDCRVARETLGLIPEQPVVLFVGRIDPIKGVDTLLDAAALLLDQPHDGHRPTFLLVGGDLDEGGNATGPLSSVVRAVEERGMTSHFRFEGSQPQDTLPIYYRAADLVAVPSRYESFGLVAVEAMACATPVVASHVGGLTFTVEDGDTGLLVPPCSPEALATAMRLLLADPERRQEMGQAARQAAERFAWPAVAASVHHVYDRLAAGYRANLCDEEEIYA